MLMPEMRAMPYPCRCLCRGFEQMTSTAPWRRMILHFSHIGLTDGRTFMEPFGGETEEDARAARGRARARPSNLAQASGCAWGSAGRKSAVLERFTEAAREAVVLAADDARILGHD